MKDIGITISFLISGLFGAILMASKNTETGIRSTILSILGFNDVTTVQSSLTFIIESIHCANLASVKTINIATNVTTMNINKAIPNNNSIIASIPVNSPPYSIIQYENTNNCRANLYINSLSMLNIKLIDDLGYLIDLNGVHYSMTFQIDIVSFR